MGGDDVTIRRYSDDDDDTTRFDNRERVGYLFICSS